MDRDHSAYLRFVDIVMTQQQLETIYRSSWAAAKAINIPVDDMFTPGRVWTDDDTGRIDAYQAAESALQLHKNLTGAMKAGPLYGEGALIILTVGEDPASELVVENIREGGVANLLAVDRWSMGITAWHSDPTMPNYGLPYMYHVTPRVGPQMLLHVHHSRVLRFPGVEAPLTEGWNSLERDWGISKLNATINEIAREEAMHVGIDHLIQEASVKVVKVHGVKDAMMGRQDRDEPSLTQMGQALSTMASLWRTLFMDASDEADRLAVNFQGLAQLVERKAVRLGSMFDIPVTRFLGTSPGGLNSTGDSDTLNYSVGLESKRERFLAHNGRVLFEAVARHAGMDQPPEHEWAPIQQIAPKDRAEMYAKQAEAILGALEKGAILEAEAREKLSMLDQWFGSLDDLDEADLEELRSLGLPPAPEPPEGDPEPEGGDGTG